jgi:hypothetical protein
MASSVLRPRDADALRADLIRVAEASGMPLTFGGEVHDDTLLLTEFFGTRTGGMRGLAVLPSAGQNGSRSSRRRSRVYAQRGGKAGQPHAPRSGDQGPPVAADSVTRSGSTGDCDS